jgi:hypothetical protein
LACLEYTNFNNMRQRSDVGGAVSGAPACWLPKE